MAKKQKRFKPGRLVQLLCICCFVFAAPPSYAAYYGGHHYKPYYGYYGYNYHRPYYSKHHRHYRTPYHRTYYNRHHGHYGRYGVSTRFSGDAAYVVLGILGAAILGSIFTNNKPAYKDTYPKTTSTTPPTKVVKTAPVKYKTPVKKTIYYYDKNEGWDWLAKGNADYALDIFAVQSQQNLNSGTPKVGFAIAAASMACFENMMLSTSMIFAAPKPSGDLTAVTAFDRMCSSLATNSKPAPSTAARKISETSLWHSETRSIPLIANKSNTTTKWDEYHINLSC